MTFRLLGLLVFTIALSPLFGQQRMISHVTKADGGFSSTIVLENTSATSQTVTLSPFDEDGVAGTAVTLTLEANTASRSDAAEMLGDATSHVAISGSNDVKANVYYDFKAGNSSPAFVGESAEQGSVWRIFPGNWDKVFDGVAFVNTGSVDTDVWIAQKDYNNNVLAAQKIGSDLAPNAKGLFVIGSPSDRPFSSDQSYFEVSADQPLALTALQGTLQNESFNILLASESRSIGDATSSRDDKGVWFIKDGSLSDVSEMMGYNVATDRLWQMEIYRRQARGTFGEIFTTEIIPTVLAIDSRNRRNGFSDAELDSFFNALDNDSKVLISAYVDGVNRRIGQVNSDSSLLPIEFKLIANTSVAPWTNYDLMAHLASFQLGFSMRSYGTEQILNAAILQDLTLKYGAEQAALMFNDIRYTSDPESQTMVASAPEVKNAEKLAYLRSDLQDFRAQAYDFVKTQEDIRNDERKHGILVKGGSYAWAVSGAMTESGNPMLYSGPQVGFAMPNLFVEGSIESDALTVSGMLIPGIPAVIVGRTPHHAWSMQVGSAGVWDYYLEAPENIHVVRQERIKVKGQADTIIDVEYSDHGPVIGTLGDQRLSIKYSQRDYNWSVGPGLIGLSRANSMDDFQTAVGNLAVTQHICYVDKDGNIAYFHAGRQPVRPEGDYRLPQGMLANQDVLEWDAAVIEPMITERNPAKGWFGGWNNKPNAEFHDESATAGFGPYHRGHMVRDFFNSYDPEHKWTFEDIRELALKLSASGGFAAGGNPWTVLGDAITEAVTAQPSETRQAGLALFDDWDGAHIAGGPSHWATGTDLQDASILLQTMIPKLIVKTFNDELGAPQIDLDMIGRFQVFLHGIRETGLQHQYDWFSNLDDNSAPQTAEAIILAALDESLAELGAQPWGTDKRDETVYYHVLLGDTRPFGIEASPAGNRSTYAQCVEYGPEGPVRIESMFALGESGLVTGSAFAPVIDPNVTSMKEDFDNFIMRAFPLFP